MDRCVDSYMDGWRCRWKDGCIDIIDGYTDGWIASIPLSFHPCICRHTQPSICPSMYKLTNTSSQLYCYLSSHISIYISTHAPGDPSIDHQSIHRAIPPSVHPPIYPPRQVYWNRVPSPAPPSVAHRCCFVRSFYHMEGERVYACGKRHPSVGQVR